MSMKRVVPIFLLLTLVLSVVACQADTAEEAAIDPLEETIAESEPASEVETGAVGEAEADETIAQNAAQPSAAAARGAAPAPEFVPPKPVTLATDAETVAFAMGDPDAAVQVVEFTDYECPFCQRYGLETMPAVVENLVESGRLFYVIKDLPLDSLHPTARSASVAARCAGEQDTYLPMHDAIFVAQAEWRGPVTEREPSLRSWPPSWI